jgi:hypothetical protein
MEEFSVVIMKRFRSNWFEIEMTKRLNKKEATNTSCIVFGWTRRGLKHPQFTAL